MSTLRSKLAAKKEKEKKEKHQQQEKVVDIVKRSILDVLKDNFKLAQRNTFVHRSIYIGEHMYNDPEDTSISEVYERIVKRINDKYCDEKLTGYLLHYSKYFCVVMDGSEETLLRHQRMLLQQDATVAKLGRLKLLCPFHHVNQRMLKEWLNTTGKPPTLLEKMNPNAEIKQTMQKVKYVIDKLFSLGLLLRPNEIIEREEKEDEDSESKSESSPSQSNVTSVSKVDQSFGSVDPAISPTMAQIQPTSQCMPEYSVLEFLLESPFTMELRNLLKAYGEVPFLSSYENLVWPVGTDFTPMNISAVDVDPIAEIDPDIILKN